MLVMSGLQVVRATAADADGVCELYNHYIAQTTCTLQEKLLAPAYFADAITTATGSGNPYFVAKKDGAVAGFCYADVMRSRCAYRYSYELSIYVAHTQTGGGIGRALMDALLRQVAAMPICNLVAVITLPNPQSVAFHEAFGFAHCGTLPALGKKFEQWWDVGFWLKSCKKKK